MGSCFQTPEKEVCNCLVFKQDMEEGRERERRQKEGQRVEREKGQRKGKEKGQKRGKKKRREWPYGAGKISPNYGHGLQGQNDDQEASCPLWETEGKHAKEVATKLKQIRLALKFNEREISHIGFAIFLLGSHLELGIHLKLQSFIKKKIRKGIVKESKH